MKMSNVQCMSTPNEEGMKQWEQQMIKYFFKYSNQANNLMFKFSPIFESCLIMLIQVYEELQLTLILLVSYVLWSCLQLCR